MRKSAAVEESSACGNARVRVPAVFAAPKSTTTDGLVTVTPITTHWPTEAESAEIRVDDYVFFSVISRQVRFDTPGGGQEIKLVNFCNCRYINNNGVFCSSCGLLPTTTQAPRHNNPRPSLFHAILYRALKPGGDGSQADALGWTFDRNILEELHLCMANAQRNRYRQQAFLESCADTLQSLHIPDDARSTCLECVHTTAVENVLQQERDQTNALVTASTTEDMCRLALPVEKSSFAYKAVASMNLIEVEQNYVLNRTALKPDDDDAAGADDASSDLLWPLISASQLRRSVVENLTTKVWVVEFTRKGGDIFSMYSVVVPGTLLEIGKTRMHFSTFLLSIITYLSCLCFSLNY